MRRTRAKYHYAIRRIKNNSQLMEKVMVLSIFFFEFFFANAGEMFVDAVINFRIVILYS